MTWLCQERKDGCGHSQPGQLHTPVPPGKPVKGCSSTVDTCPSKKHPSSLGAASPLSRLFQPLRPRVKWERKSVRVSPMQDANTALLQRLRNVGMAPEHLPSPPKPHTAARTLRASTASPTGGIPGASPSPPARIPCNKKPSLLLHRGSGFFSVSPSARQDLAAQERRSPRPHRGPSSPRTLTAERCSPFLLQED